jgi:hypothetical protein
MKNEGKQDGRRGSRKKKPNFTGGPNELGRA